MINFKHEFCAVLPLPAGVKPANNRAHVVYAAAETAMQAAILAQAYALQRYLPWNRFKQTISQDVVSAVLHPMAWSYEDHHAIDYGAIPQLVPQAPAKVGRTVAAYRETEEGVEFRMPDVHAEAISAARSVAATRDDCARWAYQELSGTDKVCAKDIFIAMAGLMFIDNKVKMNITQKSDEKYACLSFSSSKWPSVAAQFKSYMQRYGHCVLDGPSPATLLVKWHNLVPYMGTVAAGSYERKLAEYGLA